PVLFPFGHGLSYTTFSYNNEKLEGNTLTLTVTNTGDRAGAETVMLFADNKKAQVRELIAFEKVLLQPGECKEICFAVPSTHENAGTKKAH
ncbi:MAG: hypothetical protein IJ803_00575, partial [Oribacterium sp.]|nr:hypothetical protein [Oribacterium sp.]